MKVRNTHSYCILAIIIFLNFVIHTDAAAVLTKTKNFDARSGFAETLPFDERFNIHITNLADTSLHCLQLIVKEFPNRRSQYKAKVNKAYYSSLDTFMIIDFKNTLDAPTTQTLNPNRYYAFDLVSCDVIQVPLTSDEAEKLSYTLNHDIELRNGIFRSLATNYLGSGDVTGVNKIIAAKIKAINPSYVVDVSSSAISKAEFIKLNSSVHNTLVNVGKNIQDLTKDTTMIDDATKVSLKKMIGHFRNAPDTSDISIALMNPNEDDYKKTFNALMDNIRKKIDTSQLQALEDFRRVNDNNIDTAIAILKQWNDAYIKMLRSQANSTYKLISIANTVQNDTSFQDGSTNKFGTSVSQSVGLGYVPKSAKCMGYIAYSVFFRPINNDVPFSAIPSWGERLKAIFGVNFGFTLTDMTTNGYGTPEGATSILGNKAIFTGLCIRPMAWFKIDFNGLMYTMSNPNPLNNHKRFEMSPLIGVSINFNLFKLIQGQPNSFSAISSK